MDWIRAAGSVVLLAISPLGRVAHVWWWLSGFVTYLVVIGLVSAGTYATLFRRSVGSTTIGFATIAVVAFLFFIAATRLQLRLKGDTRGRIPKNRDALIAALTDFESACNKYVNALRTKYSVNLLAKEENIPVAYLQEQRNETNQLKTDYEKTLNALTRERRISGSPFDGWLDIRIIRVTLDVMGAEHQDPNFPDAEPAVFEGIITISKQIRTVIESIDQGRAYFDD